MKLVRVATLIISIVFLLIGISNVLTMGNLGGFMAIAIGVISFIIFIGFSKIREFLSVTNMWLGIFK